MGRDTDDNTKWTPTLSVFFRGVYGRRGRGTGRRQGNRDFLSNPTLSRVEKIPHMFTPHPRPPTHKTRDEAQEWTVPPEVPTESPHRSGVYEEKVRRDVPLDAVTGLSSVPTPFRPMSPVLGVPSGHVGEVG